ncbi:MAG: hypothetical protein NUW37_09625 [Planctomycetes bacterium]|nr:hypothetical protein [Planctomycetota bacterium]
MISELMLDKAESYRKSFSKAIRELYHRKALLGQNVVIKHDGKIVTIPASEALKLHDESVKKREAEDAIIFNDRPPSD